MQLNKACLVVKAELHDQSCIQDHEKVERVLRVDLPSLSIMLSFLLILFLWGIKGSDQEFYLQQLLLRVQRIEALVRDISVIRENLNINIHLVSTVEEETRLRYAAFQDETQLSLQLWSQMFFPVSIKTWKCPSLNKLQHSSIHSQLNLLAFQAQESQESIKGQLFCYRNQRIKHQNEFIKRTIDGLKKQIVSNCSSIAWKSQGLPFLLTQYTKNIPNLQARSAWTYGNITQRDYNDKINELQSVYGAILCPINIPFLSKNNNCFSCKKPGQIYDISLKQCKPCLSGCTIDGGLFNSDITGGNYMGNLNKQDLAQFCPQSEPFFDGRHCIACNFPLYFDLMAKQCKQCPTNTGFDLKQRQCLNNLYYLSLEGNHKNYIGGSFSPPPFSTIKKCPSSKPYSNGKQCLQCILPLFFNYHTGKCEQCPSGLSFDISRRVCSGGGKGTKKNSNLLGQKNFMGNIPIYDRLYEICPSDKRFFNGIECISCKSPKYFSFESMKCEECISSQLFDTQVQSCISKNLLFYTNLASSNIYYNGNFKDLEAHINQSKQKGRKECQISNPFFSLILNQCISCTGATPFFDFKHSKCINCPSGSNYSPQSKICISQQVSLSVQRMIMNTI